ncbi:MAG: lipid-transfer protein [Acidimicrobiales bacterium]
MAAPDDIAIIGVAQTPAHDCYDNTEPTLLMAVVNQLLSEAGLERSDVDFTIAGSCDYLSGMPFAFVANVDGVGAWPPVYESHVEMDGAWALFEAWLRLQLGDIDIALVLGSGKSSPTDSRQVFPLQGDPYFTAPLGFDPVSYAGIQARALIEADLATEADFAAVVARSLADGATNPNALRGDPNANAAALLAEPHLSAPLRHHDVSPKADGAAGVLIARGERARQLCADPVWIRGIDHRIESHHPGLRDLVDAPSVRLAADRLDLAAGALDVAELHVTHSHEETILRRVLGLADTTAVNPSGGPLCGDPVMATGLIRVIEVAQRIADGSAGRGLAHASSGAALQQNLLCVLEGDS